MTGVDDAAASPTAAAKFEEPASESEVTLSDKQPCFGLSSAL